MRNLAVMLITVLGAASAETASSQAVAVNEGGEAGNPGGAGAAAKTPTGVMEADAVVDAENLGALADIVVLEDRDAYAVSDEAPKLARFTLQGGEMKFAEAVDLEGEASGRGILVLDDGKTLWVRTGGNWSHDDAVVFERDPASGKLTRTGMAKLPPDTGEDVAGPKGDFLYTAQGRGNVIGIHERDGDSWKTIQELNFVPEVDGKEVGTTSGGSSTLSMGSEGKFLYATSDKAYDSDRKLLADYRLYVFERDQKTGKLSEVAFYEHDKDGVELPRQPKAMAISPDGKHVWIGGAAGMMGGELATFERDPNTGKLTFAGKKKVAAPAYIEKAQQAAEELGNMGPMGAVPTGIAATTDAIYIAIDGTPGVARFAR